MKSKQRGYIKLDGIGEFLMLCGVVIGVVGMALGALAMWGLPQLWAMFKPWLHQITG